MMAAADGRKLDFLAAHAHSGLGIRDPDGSVLAAGRFSTFLQQVSYTLPNVVHPLRLLGGRGGVDGKRLSGCLNEPTVA